MDNRNSIERLKSIQLSLSELSNSLEETYFKMRQECKDEIIKDIKTHDTKKDEMRNLYEQLSNSEQRRINWIKNRLPWYVTIFRTIHSYEISLIDTSIFIGVSFGKEHKACCYIKLTPIDIGWKSI